MQGDGVGAEVSEVVKQIFKADNVPIEWEQIDVSGVESGDKHTEELFRESIASLKRNKIGLKGAPAYTKLLTGSKHSQILKESSTHPSLAAATSPSTSLSDKNSTSTPPSS